MGIAEKWNAVYTYMYKKELQWNLSLWTPL